MKAETDSNKKAGILINRNYAFYWTGQVISRFGDYIFDTTLILWITTQIARNQSWAPLAVSGLLIAVAVPVLLIGPIAGVFVDRWVNKRQTMLRMDALRAILIAFLLIITSIGSLPFISGSQPSVFWQIGLIYAVVFLASVCAQFFNPASGVLFGDIVEEAYRTRASGLGQTMESLALIAGPPLAALLFFSVGVKWALLLNALSFVISFIAVFKIRVPDIDAPAPTDEAPASFFQEFGAGLRFYAQNKVLLTILITVILVVMWDGAFNALGIFFVLQNLHAPASFYAVLQMALGLGLAAGALGATVLTRRVGAARMLWSSILAMGLLVLIYARLTSSWAAFIVVFLIGMTIAATNVPIDPLVLHVTPREFIGRAIAVFRPVTNLASIISVALAGWLVSTILHNFHVSIAGAAFGPIDTLLLVGGIFILIGGGYALLNLRNVTLQDEGKASSEEGEPSFTVEGTPSELGETQTPLGE
jgi:MFS family permease